jgi:surfactin synthase thioesterase subunit
MSVSFPLVSRMDAWFGRPASRADSASLLFCLPYSAAGTSVFEAWSQHLPPAVQALGVRLPGREQRIAEPFGLVPDDIAAAIAARADRPYAIYGHSLGARLGFEVLRSRRRTGAAQPSVFYPAAASSPDVADRLASSVELSDDDFLDALISRLSAPVELRDEPELPDAAGRRYVSELRPQIRGPLPAATHRPQDAW